jgi:hypothetical protein
LTPTRTLVIACGALARELKAVMAASAFPSLALVCLPAILHNRPHEIPEAVRASIRVNRARFDRILCAYGDCGTGGALDRVLEQEGVERLAGAHCYDILAGPATFAALMDEEPGTFFLTDYLVRHFDRLIISGLGLDRYPELREAYFGAYRRVVYLSQATDPDLLASAERAAGRLGLAFGHRPTGLGRLAGALRRVAG